MVLRRKRLVFLLVTACVLLVIWRLPVSDQYPAQQDLPIDQQGASQKDKLQPDEARDQAHAAPITTTAIEPLVAGAGQHPLDSINNFIPLPTAGVTIPRIQHDFKPEGNVARELRKTRLDSIREAMVHSWTGYREKAWLKDELAPVTGGYRTTLYGWAATMVDALDTLWLMGLHGEFEEAVEAVAGIDFNTPAHLPINVFETTIRYLGGLLAAHDVSGGKYPVLLRKAKEVGDMLYQAFDTPNRMPVTRWSKIGVEVAAGDTLVAELGSLSLEFTRLTQLTGDPKFYDAVQRISDCLESQQTQTKMPGLFPHTVNARECYFGDGVTFSIGGSADSVYEYLPKQHQLLKGTSEQYKNLYLKAAARIKTSILFKPMTPQNEEILLAGVLKAYGNGQVDFQPQMQHLACFAGGMFALGAKLFGPASDMDTADKLVRGCIWAYNQTAAGIMPETFHAILCPDIDSQCTWDESIWAEDMLRRNTHDDSPADKSLRKDERVRRKADRLRLPKGISAIANRGYNLRPELIESIFILYRITGDEELREAAWAMFGSITQQTRTNFGFSSIEDVTQLNSLKVDKMESYWMAETLKYFWLLFEDPDVLSLDEYVFNTEAHPIRLQT